MVQVVAASFAPSHVPLQAMYLFSFTSSIEPGVLALALDFSLNFVDFPIITILSIVPLRSVISVLSSLRARTFPLSRPALPFVAAKHAHARGSTIPSMASLESLGIGFSGDRRKNTPLHRGRQAGPLRA